MSLDITLLILYVIVIFLYFMLDMILEIYMMEGSRMNFIWNKKTGIGLMLVLIGVVYSIISKNVTLMGIELGLMFLIVVISVGTTNYLIEKDKRLKDEAA